MARRDLNLMAALDALLRERNVTRAAHALHLSQPTMSGLLQRLRDLFGDPLLVRVGREYELTPRAQEMSGELHQALLTLDAILASGRSPDLAGTRRHFVIMASEFSAGALLPELFARAAEVAPGMTFEVTGIANAIDSVHGGRADLCLMGASVAGMPLRAAEAVRTQVLFGDSYVCLVHRDHPVGSEFTRDDYLSFPHIAIRFAGSASTLEEQAATPDLPAVAPRILLPGFAAVAAFLADRRSLVVVPRRVMVSLDRAANVRAVEPPAPFGTLKLRMLWHVRHDGDRTHRWLRRQVIDIARRPEDDPPPRR
ncbi:LysR family transcriptional regulator [Sphingobium chungangianum]